MSCLLVLYQQDHYGSQNQKCFKNFTLSLLKFIIQENVYFNNL